MRISLYSFLVLIVTTLVGFQVFGPLEQLDIVTSKGIHEFEVDIADDPLERAQGLMCQESNPEDCQTELPKDYGMLFDFGDEQPRGFWMKNTHVPLDMIFIRSNGTVASIAKNAEPLNTQKIIRSGAAVQFVLEVEAGVTADIGLKVGDKVRHSRMQ